MIVNKFYTDNNIKKLKIGDSDIIRVINKDRAIYPSVIKDGLVAWYDFNGKTNHDTIKNIVKDLSGNGNDGELVNFGYTEDSGWGDGGLKFDGVDDWLCVDDFQVFGGDFTIEICIDYIDETTNIMRAMGDLENHNGFLLEPAKRRFRWWYNGTSIGTNISLNGLIKKNRTTFLVRKIENSVTVYQDDIQIGEGNVINNQFEKITNFIVGNYASDGRNYEYSKTKVYIARIYNRALTEEEILHNYKVEQIMRGDIK